MKTVGLTLLKKKGELLFVFLEFLTQEARSQILILFVSFVF